MNFFEYNIVLDEIQESIVYSFLQYKSSRVKKLSNKGFNDNITKKLIRFYKN